MRRSPRTVPLILWVAAAVMPVLSLMLAAPATADTVSPAGDCPSGGRTYSSAGASSVTVTAPDGYRITSFCVVGRGNAGPEVHTLSTPQESTVIRHSSGKRLESYSVTYVRAPVTSEPEDEAAAEAETTAEAERKAERTPAAQEIETQPSDPVVADESAPPGKSAPPAVSAPLSTQSGDGEQLQITTFEEREEREDRWSFMVVGSIIVVGLLAGAIALLVRLPGQR